MYPNDDTPAPQPRDNTLDDRFNRFDQAWQGNYFHNLPASAVDPFDKPDVPKDDPYRS
jgi:hypothetical protein